MAAQNKPQMFGAAVKTLEEVQQQVIGISSHMCYWFEFDH